MYPSHGPSFTAIASTAILAYLAASSLMMVPFFVNVHATGVFFGDSNPGGSQASPSVIGPGSTVTLWVDVGSSNPCCILVAAYFRALDGTTNIEPYAAMPETGPGASTGTTRYSISHTFGLTLYSNGLQFQMVFVAYDQSGSSGQHIAYALIQGQSVLRYVAENRGWYQLFPTGSQFDTQVSDGKAYSHLAAVSDFTLSVSSPTTTVSPGQTALYTVGITSWNGFKWQVSLSVSISPSGPSYTIASSQLTPPPDGFATTTLSVSSSTQGSFDIWVTGTGGLQTHSYKATLTVTSTPPPPPPPGGGGSPFVYAWNGTGYTMDNNLLPKSQRTGDFVRDYYFLRYRPVLGQDGLVPLMIGEFEDNHDYFDQAELTAVTHSNQVRIGVSPEGDILTYRSPISASTALDDAGSSVLPLLAGNDGAYWQGAPGRFLTVEYASVPASGTYKLVIVSDGCTIDCKLSIHVQVQDPRGEWEDVAIIIPRVYFSTDVVDVSRYLPDPNGKFKVRLYFTSDHKLDYVGLDTSPQDSITTTELDTVSATHSWYGDVLQKLRTPDGGLVDITPNQKIWLKFAAPPTVPAGQQLDYLITSLGRYFPMGPTDTRATGDPWYALNVTYTFTTGGIDKSTISAFQVYAEAWTETSSTDRVSLQIWNQGLRTWSDIGSFAGTTSRQIINTGGLGPAYICPSSQCGSNNIVLRWYFSSTNFQTLNVDYVHVKLYDTRSNQDVVIAAYRKDLMLDAAVPSDGAAVSAYAGNPPSLAASCTSDESGSCVLNIPLNKYDFWAMSSDYGYGMTPVNITSSPFSAINTTVGMSPPGLSTKVFDVTSDKPYVEPLFTLVLDRSQTGPSIRTTPFFNMTQLSSRPREIVAYNDIYWRNVSIAYYFYWWDSQNNRLWLDEESNTFDAYRQYMYLPSLHCRSDTIPYWYYSRPTGDQCYNGFPNYYNPWYPSDLLNIAVHGDCYLGGQGRRYCEDLSSPYNTPYSFLGVTALLRKPEMSMYRGVVAYGYGYVGRTDPVRYALDSVASQLFSAFSGVKQYYGNSDSALSAINGLYSTLQTAVSASSQVSASTSLRMYAGNYSSSFAASIYKYYGQLTGFSYPHDKVVVSSGVVPDVYSSFMGFAQTYQKWAFTDLAAVSSLQFEAFLDGKLLDYWGFSDSFVDSLTCCSSDYLPVSLRQQVIYGLLFDALSAKSFKAATNPSLFPSIYRGSGNWIWANWYNSAINRPLSGSTRVNSPLYQADVFQRTVDSYIQGLKTGSLPNATFIDIKLFPVKVEPFEQLVNYTYRVVYKTYPVYGLNWLSDYRAL